MTVRPRARLRAFQLIGRRECRRIVNPVADHRDRAAAVLEFGHQRGLVLGQHLCLDAVDAQRAHDCVGIPLAAFGLPNPMLAGADSYPHSGDPVIQSRLPDMTCGDCANRVTQAVEQADPTCQVAVDLSRYTVQVLGGRERRQPLAEVLTDAGCVPV